LITSLIESLIFSKFAFAFFLSILGNPRVFKTLPKIGILNNSVFVRNLIDTGRAVICVKISRVDG
jgi:hypothetical protein